MTCGCPARSCQNPKIASVVTGDRSAPETLDLLFSSRPEFRALYREQMNSADILDYRPELAMAKALARWFIDRAKLEDFDNSAGKTPPALLAIDRLERVVTIGKRCLEIEASLGAISHEELQYWIDCVTQTLHRFLPPEKEAAAKAFLRERIRAREQVMTAANVEE